MHPSTVSLGPADNFAEATLSIGLTKSYGVFTAFVALANLRKAARHYASFTAGLASNYLNRLRNFHHAGYVQALVLEIGRPS